MTQNLEKQPLQVWGGVEPTINRIGDQYFKQFDRSGHRQRLSDLDEFARLGLRTLRFLFSGKRSRQSRWMSSIGAPSTPL